jgi:hypothetical protein
MGPSDRPNARLCRCYATGAVVFDVLYHLIPVESKPNALDQAFVWRSFHRKAQRSSSSLQGWALTEAFQLLSHLLKARMANRGKREFIQVLRLIETRPMAAVTDAVTGARRPWMWNKALLIPCPRHYLAIGTPPSA